MRNANSFRPRVSPASIVKRIVFLGSFALLLLAVPTPSAPIPLGAQSAPSETEQLFTESHPAMGTTYMISLYATSPARAAVLFMAAFDEIDRVDDLLSNYKETSELSRISRLGYPGPVTTDPETFRFLEISFNYSRQSDGAFDITVGPLMRAWGFFRGTGHYPTREELAKALASTGWQHVHLDPTARTIRFDVPGMELDPGGIGKGYAVERVITLLRSLGVKTALVDAGSSTIYALGAPPGQDGWVVRIPVPGDRTKTISSVTLRDTSLSTSGDYEKFFQLDGKIYCHIMDPKTGEPIHGMLQTTVITPNPTDSDALSLVMFGMGPEGAEKMMEPIPATSGLWIMGTPDAMRVARWRWPADVRIPESISRPR